jgi:tRNA(adenine34) deaminase
MKPFQSAAMHRALAEAEAAGARGEVPVGAVVTGPDGEILAADGNRTLELNDPTAHAEMLAIRAAAARSARSASPACDLHVTLEPCAMCAAAISFARMRRLYYGATDPKQGAVDSGPRFFTQPTCHHAPEVYGGMAEASPGAVDQFLQRAPLTGSWADCLSMTPEASASNEAFAPPGQAFALMRSIMVCQRSMRSSCAMVSPRCTALPMAWHRRG